MKLVRRGSVEHAEDLQDVAITVIAMELVPCPVEAQHQLAGSAPAVAGVIGHCVIWKGMVMSRSRKKLLVGVRHGFVFRASSVRMGISRIRRRVQLIHLARVPAAWDDLGNVVTRV